MKTGAQLISAERKRQIQKEGWSDFHDDGHDRGELAAAAACYILFDHKKHDLCPEQWPWDWRWWKPTDDRVRNLVKAGALIAAEIDRLQRKAR